PARATSSSCSRPIPGRRPTCLRGRRSRATSCSRPRTAPPSSDTSCESGEAMSEQTPDISELRALIDRAIDERLAARGAEGDGGSPQSEGQREGRSESEGQSGDKPERGRNRITIVAWDGHLDRIWPTLILSTTAAASGM